MRLEISDLVIGLIEAVPEGWEIFEGYARWSLHTRPSAEVVGSASSSGQPALRFAASDFDQLPYTDPVLFSAP